MSYSLNFYVGAYLEIVADPVILIATKMGCPQCQKPMEKDGKFCPDCGTKKLMVNFRKEQKASIYTLLPEDEYTDILFEAYRPGIEGEGLILCGNTSNLGDSLPVGEEDQAIEISPQTIADCLRIFSQHYLDIIETIGERAKIVQLKFGAFCYIT